MKVHNSIKRPTQNQMKYNAIDSKALKIRHDTPALQFRDICALTYDVDDDHHHHHDKIKGGSFFFRRSSTMWCAFNALMVSWTFHLQFFFSLHFVSFWAHYRSTGSLFMHNFDFSLPFSFIRGIFRLNHCLEHQMQWKHTL